jgi:signal transduction histidine kinase
VSENNLKELNITKDKFFSIISHDLKNPFSSVLSISELMDENFENTDKQELKYGLAKIHQTNKHIYELLENLLTWSKTQRGSITLEKNNFNLTKTIETNINILKLSAEKKNISIHKSMTENIYAFGDREMISTVVRNLLNNAVKFTPPGKNVYIKILKNTSFIKIEIKDEGIGIDSENLDRLFRIEDKYKTDGTAGEKGTGLGLIICKEFVEKNDGTIEVSSRKGTGSTFTFSVPCGKEP